MTVQLRIELGAQRLLLFKDNQLLDEYSISSAANGPGEAEGSGCTPRGKHRIKFKIGAGCVPGSVFIGRRPSGEVYSDQLATQFPDRDWILTRILWLTGSESGFNRGRECDTLRRYIYIHGTPPGEPMGIPRSHGCIRMHDQALLKLFENVEVGTTVEIIE